LTREIRRYVPIQWEPVNADLWIDQTDGEELTLLEPQRRYRLPSKLQAMLQQDVPDRFTQLIERIDCHLIETQRLLVLPTGDVELDDDTPPYFRRRRSQGSRLAIQQKAEKLKSILKDTLTTYANLSQSLDRSFPLRVFDAQGSAKLSEDELRQELKRLDERREALIAAGILDTDYQPVTMRGGNIEPGVATVLEIYVKDAVEKLNVFNSWRSKVDLLKEIIKTRFIDKSIQIDRESGFKIISKTGYEIPLETLSSG
jgi:hypothetical protein